VLSAESAQRLAEAVVQLLVVEPTQLLSVPDPVQLLVVEPEQVFPFDALQTL
jgi:hypothetical protein